MKIKLWSAFAVFMLSVFLDVSQSFAATTSVDDDYNFSWLDPDKKIYVLQNRRYRKTGAPMLFLLGGSSIGETYRTVYQLQPRFGVWFTEEMGIEAFYSARFNSLNNAYRALASALDPSVASVTKSPYIREINSEFGLLFNWAPWYAKINVFNSVLYFDWYFSLGAGTMSSNIGPKTKDDSVAGSSWTSESLFAVYVGTGQLFHLSEHWKIRLDVLGHFYSAKIYQGIPNTPTDKAIFSNFGVNLGIGYKL